MKSKVISSLVLISLIVSMLLPLPTQAQAVTYPVHNIGTGEDCSTIQAAITDPDTKDGHTVTVDPGTCTEEEVALPAPQTGLYVVEEFPICTNPAMQEWVDIDGNFVVWEDLRGDKHGDIYGYDLSNQQEFPICSEKDGQWFPTISGQFVFWADGGKGYPDWEWPSQIKGYNLLTKSEFSICGDAGDGGEGVVDGNVVVWIDSDTVIRGCDISSGHEFLIESAKPTIGHVGGDKALDIKDGVVVWIDWRNKDRDIYGYDLSTQTEFAICTAPGDQESPATNGNIVVWADSRRGGSDIYGYDLSTKTEFPICTNEEAQFAPAIDQSIIVWTDLRDGNADIYGYDLKTKTEFPICQELGAQSLPAISGDIVVWLDGRNVEPDSYLHDIYGARLTKVEEKPDLVVTDISWSPSSPKAGDTVTFTVHIKNQGNADADPWAPFRLNCYVDDGSKWCQYIEIDALPAGISIARQFNWEASAGSHTVASYVDCYHCVPEGNEDNNYRKEAFTVSGEGKPDLVVTDILWSPPSPKARDTMTFTIYVANIGNADADVGAPFYLHFFVEDTYFDHWLIDRIPAGGSIVREHIIYLYGANIGLGNHTVSARVDEYDYVPESNEDNNRREETFAIGEEQDVKFRGVVENEPSEPPDIEVRIDEILLDPEGKLSTGDLAHIDIAEDPTKCDVDWPLHKGDRVEVYAKHYEYAYFQYAIGVWIYSRDHQYDGYLKKINGEVADLVISDISWSPPEPQVGDEIAITFTVKNIGAATAYDFGQGWGTYPPQFQDRDYQIPSLAPDETKTFTVRFVIDEKFAEGCKQVYGKPRFMFIASADIRNGISESDEENNSKEVWIPFLEIVSLPDLSIPLVYTAPLYPNMGDEVDIWILVTNEGAEVSEPFKLSLYMDDSKVDEISIPSIGSNVCTQVSYEGIDAQEGSHKLEVVVDEQNEIEEQDESNNTYSTSVEVPQLILRDVFTDHYCPGDHEWTPYGNTITTIVLENPTLTMKHINITLLANGEVVSDCEARLEAESTSAINLWWMAKIGGTYDLTILVEMQGGPSYELSSSYVDPATQYSYALPYVTAYSEGWAGKGGYIGDRLVIPPQIWSPWGIQYVVSTETNERSLLVPVRGDGTLKVTVFDESSEQIGEKTEQIHGLKPTFIEVPINVDEGETEYIVVTVEQVHGFLEKFFLDMVGANLAFSLVKLGWTVVELINYGSLPTAQPDSINVKYVAVAELSGYPRSDALDDFSAKVGEEYAWQSFESALSDVCDLISGFSDETKSLAARSVIGNEPRLDASIEADTLVKIRDARYFDPGSGGFLRAYRSATEPMKTTSFMHGTDKVPLKFVDVQACGFASGVATIKIAYTEEETRGANIDENTLTIFYWCGSSWVEASNVELDTDANTVQGDMPVVALAGTPIGVGGDSRAGGRWQGYWFIIGGCILCAMLIVAYYMHAKRRKSQKQAQLRIWDWLVQPVLATEIIYKNCQLVIPLQRFEFCFIGER